MKAVRATLRGGVVAVGLVAYALAMAQDIPAAAVLFIPSKAKWAPSAAAPGVETAPIYGSASKPGRYLSQAKFPPIYVLKPHSHPDERHYTVLSGTWYIGFGTQFDESKLIALPAGSFYTEPANTPHFVATKADGAVVQLGGDGPSRLIWVNPQDDPGNKK